MAHDPVEFGHGRGIGGLGNGGYEASIPAHALLGGADPLLDSRHYGAHRRGERVQAGIEQPVAESPLGEQQARHDEDRGGEDEIGADEELERNPAGSSGATDGARPRVRAQMAGRRA